MGLAIRRLRTILHESLLLSKTLQASSWLFVADSATMTISTVVQLAKASPVNGRILLYSGQMAASRGMSTLIFCESIREMDPISVALTADLSWDAESRIGVKTPL